MRLSCHEVTFDVPAELIAKHISAVFPKGLATGRASAMLGAIKATITKAGRINASA